MMNFEGSVSCKLELKVFFMKYFVLLLTSIFGVRPPRRIRLQILKVSFANAHIILNLACIAQPLNDH